MEQRNASLKIVPYYVIKKPSEPSLIESLMSCIALVPGSLSNIQHSIHRLMNKNTTETMRAEKAMRFGVELEMNNENKNMMTNGEITAKILIPFVFSS